MRHENQRWNAIRATMEVVVGGAGMTGLTPTVGIQRISDGQWLANGGGSWAAPFAVNNMVPVDATNAAGLYQYVIPSARLATYTDSDPGYFFVIVEATNNVREHVFVHPEKDPWEELRADHVVANTFGEGVLMETANAGSILNTSFTAGAIDAAAIANDAIDATTVANGTIDAATFAAGAIDAAAIAADAIDASALAADAVAEIADGVWDEPVAAHTTDDTYGSQMSSTFYSLVTDEGEASGLFTVDAPDATGLKVYAPNTPSVARSGVFVSRLAFLRRTANDNVVPVRITAIANDGDDYIGVVRLDGTAVPAAIAIGDELLVTNRHDPSVDEIMLEPMAGHTTAGTFGDSVNRMLRLRQSNVRVIYDTWNANGEPTHGMVYVYASKAALEGDADPWAAAVGSYEFDGTYDGSQRLTEYTSTLET